MLDLFQANKFAIRILKSFLLRKFFSFFYTGEQIYNWRGFPVIMTFAFFPPFKTNSFLEEKSRKIISCQRKGITNTQSSPFHVYFSLQELTSYHTSFEHRNAHGWDTSYNKIEFKKVELKGVTKLGMVFNGRDLYFVFTFYLKRCSSTLT